jgi:phage terminase large subunit GpA-like protein
MLLERLAQARAVLRPPPKLNLWEWADEFRYLSPEAAAKPGKWRTSHVEVARGPMEAITDPSVHIVTVMCCTQLMKTELILNTIGYYVHQDPAPMIVMQPTVHMAEAFSKDRVDTMFRDSPALAGVLPPKKSRDGGNTILHKQFPGGHLTMVGANAPGDLAMRPVRVVLCDEVDKYPGSAGDEGDPITIIGERSATFWNWKQIRTCSPTIEGRSRIALSYEESDQRVFEPACPHCGHRAEMLWQQVRWPEDSPESAAYHCPDCDQPWSESERRKTIKAARNLPGYGWTATKPFNGHAGFRVSKLASPWENLGKLARKFVEARKSPELLKAFVNTQLAETWKDKGEAPDWQRLYNRREEYARNLVPVGGLMLFAAADVQKDRIEVEIKAYGRGLESWSIDYRVFLGDTSDEVAPSSPWRQLDDLLGEAWPHMHAGVCMQLTRLAVDSGYNTQTVYRWASKYSPTRVMVIKGQPEQVVAVAAPKAIQIKANGQKLARGQKLWNVGTNLIKGELYSWLRAEPPTPGEPMPMGFHHWPEHDEEYFRQLCSEIMMVKTVKGRRVYTWEQIRPRNEVLDVHVYCRAAAAAHGLDRYTDSHWLQVEKSLGIGQDDYQHEPTEQTVNKQENAGRERVRSSYWGRR